MALPWMTVLQHVPWGELISNAPKIADGARKLWQRARHDAPPPPAFDPPELAQADGLVRLQTRVHALEQDIASASDVIRALADQQAQLVAALDAVKRRQRRAYWAVGVLAVGWGVSLIWLAGRF